jgi:predicted aconitase with swiveling domain
LTDKNVFTMGFRKITEGNISGEVLISKDAINFYLVDPTSGKIIEKGHDLEGKEIGNKVLIFPCDKGSTVVQLDGLYQMAMKGNKPQAMIVQDISTVLVSNAIIMEIPLITNVDEKFYQVVRDGDWVEIDTDKEGIVIRNKK